jgi:hypothetical protein
MSVDGSIVCEARWKKRRRRRRAVAWRPENIRRMTRLSA